MAKKSQKTVKEPKLSTREEFKEAVFKRDGYRCIYCAKPAVDSHHLLERRLFFDNGMYIENGVSLCSFCHVKAEQTSLSCEVLRKIAGIKTIVLPPCFDATKTYDKWGNTILDNGMRYPGPLFNDPGHQKILKPLLHIFDLREDLSPIKRGQWVKVAQLAVSTVPLAPGAYRRMLDVEGLVISPVPEHFGSWFVAHGGRHRQRQDGKEIYTEVAPYYETELEILKEPHATNPVPYHWDEE